MMQSAPSSFVRMNFWPQLVLTSFCVGYLTRHLDLITFTRDLIHDFPATSHKPLLLLCFLCLALAFLAILYPLERMAEWESRSCSQYTHRTSAREQLRRRGSF
ncbi:hypothetical protein H4R35_002123 [Dimargaris xerosporica]|nr:hypothetical protein H4R35_002123 [Dimargaris xerosporica]